jgi:hypothetical protein
MSTFKAWGMAALMLFPVAMGLVLINAVQQVYRATFDFLGPLLSLGIVGFTLGALISAPFIAKRKSRDSRGAIGVLRTRHGSNG